MNTITSIRQDLQFYLIKQIPVVQFQGKCQQKVR